VELQWLLQEEEGEDLGAVANRLMLMVQVQVMEMMTERQEEEEVFLPQLPLLLRVERLFNVVLDS
jgi:hypothetical protein